MAKPDKPDKPVKPDNPKKPKKVKSLHGNILSLDFESSPMAMDLRVKGKRQTVSVADDAEVFLNKVAAEFGDLLVGDNVFAVLDLVTGEAVIVDARRDVPEPEPEPSPVP